MASFYGSLFGSPASIQPVPTLSPGQIEDQNQIRNIAMQGLQNPYRGFEGIEQTARQNLMQKTLPSISQRFIGSTGAAASSPAFGSQLNQAGQEFEQGLAGLRTQYGQQQQGLYGQLLGQGLQPQFQNYSIEGQPGFLQNTAPQLGQIGMSALAGGLTGGWGAILPAIAQILQFLAGGQKGKLSQYAQPQVGPLQKTG